MMRRWFAAALIGCLLPSFAAAEGAASLARSASAQLEQAAVSLREADTRRDRIAALTETVRGYETGLSALRESLRVAVLEERALREVLNSQSDELSALLAVLQMIERRGGGAAFLHPEGTLPAIRAGMLSADLVPGLAARAEELTAELTDLSAVVALQRSAEQQLETALGEFRTARLTLAQAISNRTDLPQRVATDDAAMQALVNSAETLSGFAASLMADAVAPPPRSDWALPVLGNRLRGFEEPGADGVVRPGWTVATDEGALVTAPVAGTVRFTGPLLDQGQVVILEPHAGELLILAGLGETYAARGEIVSKGAPLGQMGGFTGTTQQNLIETARDGGQRRSETLYIEVRQAGDAVDPATRFDDSAE